MNTKMRRDVCSVAKNELSSHVNTEGWKSLVDPDLKTDTRHIRPRDTCF